MLNDITTLTKLVFEDILTSSKRVNSKKRLYDIYQNLKKVTEYIDLVANHYLVLNFTEEFLQNSSFGKPQDKWRFFLNKDLEALNLAVKDYLFSLSGVSLKDEEDSLISSKYNYKWFYGFVRDSYNVGFVQPCSAIVDIVQLNLKATNRSNIVQEYKKIELDSYEAKVNLQNYLLEQNDILKEYQKRIKEYILQKVSIEDLI